MEKKVPMRTCIACKTVKPKRELIRIVKNESGIFLDRTGKKNAHIFATTRNVSQN